MASEPKGYRGSAGIASLLLRALIAICIISAVLAMLFKSFWALLIIPASIFAFWLYLKWDFPSTKNLS